MDVSYYWIVISSNKFSLVDTIILVHSPTLCIVQLLTLVSKFGTCVDIAIEHFSHILSDQHDALLRSLLALGSGVCCYCHRRRQYNLRLQSSTASVGHPSAERDEAWVKLRGFSLVPIG